MLWIENSYLGCPCGTMSLTRMFFKCRTKCQRSNFEEDFNTEWFVLIFEWTQLELLDKQFIQYSQLGKNSDWKRNSLGCLLNRNLLLWPPDEISMQCNERWNRTRIDVGHFENDSSTYLWRIFRRPRIVRVWIKNINVWWSVFILTVSHVLCITGPTTRNHRCEAVELWKWIVN